MTNPTKLTDTQLVILNTAASRDGHAVLPLPKSLKVNKGTATTVLKALLARNLVEERPAAPGASSWRQDDDGRTFTLVISDAGLAALDSTTDATPKKSASKKTAKKNRANAKENKSQQNEPEAVTVGTKKPGGKVETILTLLQRPEGARLADLEKATGWQPHSVRLPSRACANAALKLPASARPMSPPTSPRSPDGGGG